MCVPVGDPFVHQGHRYALHTKSEKISDLPGKDDHGDSRREAGDHRIGDELDQRPHASDAEEDENDAGNQGADHQAVVAGGGHDAGDDDHEGAGGTADLHAAPAERGDEESSHDRRVDPPLRRHAGGDGECQRQGQGHDAHHHAGHQIARQLLARDAFTQTDDQFRDEQTPGL